MNVMFNGESVLNFNLISPVGEVRFYKVNKVLGEVIFNEFVQ